MNDFRISMAITSADRMGESVKTLSDLIGQIGSGTELTTAIGDLAVRVARYRRTIELAVKANVSMTDWTEHDLDRQIHDVRDLVRTAWRAWVLEATVDDELAYYQAQSDRLSVDLVCEECDRPLVDEDRDDLCGHCRAVFEENVKEWDEVSK